MGGNVRRLTAAERASFTKGQSPFVIDPRTNCWMPIWDMVMLFALGFTASWTPYEVTFLTEANVLRDGPDALWILNRVMDLLFIMDILLICNTMYEQPLEMGGMWVGSRRTIIFNYMKTPWFWIDIIAVFPFYVVGWMIAGSSIYEPDTPDGSSTNSLATVRLVKLLRMLKLARVLKASRILKRHIQEMVMGYLELTFGVLTAIELLALLIFYSHLQACFWALFSSFTAEPTWVSVYKEQHIVYHGAPAEPWEVYMAALYWSVMTVTSIGYGEMLPINPSERGICSLFMLISGMMWTYILSTAAGIASTLDPNGVLFQTTMDQLNYFMRERALPKEMRQELRDYFQSSRAVREVSDDSDLLEMMSPLLQGTVAYAANQKWLSRIWYLRAMGESRDSREFVACLAKGLSVRAFVTEERPAIGQLYVLRRGMCVKNWRFYRAGGVWGDDMIIDSVYLMDHSQAVALTFMEVFTLSREHLDESCEGFPDAMRIITGAATKIRMRRSLLLYFCSVSGKKPRSFIPQANASGYFFVTSQMSVEQKVGALHDAYIKTGELQLMPHRRSAAADSSATAQLLSRDLSRNSAQMAEVSPALYKAVRQRRASLALNKPLLSAAPLVAATAVSATPRTPRSGEQPLTAATASEMVVTRLSDGDLGPAAGGSAPTATASAPAIAQLASSVASIGEALAALSSRVEGLATEHAQQHTALMTRLEADEKKRLVRRRRLPGSSPEARQSDARHSAARHVKGARSGANGTDCGANGNACLAGPALPASQAGAVAPQQQQPPQPPLQPQCWDPQQQSLPAQAVPTAQTAPLTQPAQRADFASADGASEDELAPWSVNDQKSRPGIAALRQTAASEASGPPADLSA